MATKSEPFDVGDEIVLQADFTNTAGQPANPTTVTLLVEKPDGSETEHEQGALDNPTVGRWEKAIVVDQPGRWHWEFRGTGAIQLTLGGDVQVRESRFVYPYP